MNLTNEQYNRVMRIYDERQSESNRLLDKRKRQIHTLIPEISGVEDEIRRLAIKEISHRITDRHDSSHNDSSQIFKPLYRKKRKLLTERGFPSNYLDPIYICSDCHDTGRTSEGFCHCFRQLAIEELFNSMTSVTGHLAFKDFSLSFYPDTFIEDFPKKTPVEVAREALNSAKDFVKGFDDNFENLLIYGKPGTGKTHLSGCIGGELIRSGHTVIYLSAFELFNRLKQETFSFDGKPKTEYKELFSCDLLIIDDLGTEYANALTNSLLFEIVNERILKRQSTLISTNLTLLELASVYTDRIISRIGEYYTVLRLIGKDIRIMRGGTHAKK